MIATHPEDLARKVLDQCASCGYCREISDDLPCLFFSRLFALDEREQDKAGAIAPAEFKDLVDLCNIEGLAPERLATDCLSCRMQFNQTLPTRVLHPVEILLEAYGNA